MTAGRVRSAGDCHWYGLGADHDGLQHVHQRHRPCRRRGSTRPRRRHVVICSRSDTRWPPSGTPSPSCFQRSIHPCMHWISIDLSLQGVTEPPVFNCTSSSYPNSVTQGVWSACMRPLFSPSPRAADNMVAGFQSYPLEKYAFRRVRFGWTDPSQSTLLQVRSRIPRHPITRYISSAIWWRTRCRHMPWTPCCAC